MTILAQVFPMNSKGVTSFSTLLVCLQVGAGGQEISLRLTIKWLLLTVIISKIQTTQEKRRETEMLLS